MARLGGLVVGLVQRVGSLVHASWNPVVPWLRLLDELRRTPLRTEDALPEAAEFFELAQGAASPATGVTVTLTAFPQDISRQTEEGHYVVPPAVSFFISLHGMKAVMFHVSQRLSSYGRYVFDRDTILLPEVAMDGYDSPAPKILKPAMDALWQAAGLERCFDYADDGRWAPQP